MDKYGVVMDKNRNVQGGSEKKLPTKALFVIWIDLDCDSIHASNPYPKIILVYLFFLFV
jgi:hypothetical protein